MSRFELIQTSIEGLIKIQRKPVSDDRGFFEKFFCDDELAVFNLSIKQVNRSVTNRRGSIRGMHYQNLPHAEAKIVSCVSGSVLDVAVDLRKGSSTFLEWHGEILSADNHCSFYIPKGFAHGFQTLEDNCEMMYFHDERYEKDSEGGLNPLDETVGIKWPLEVADISDRDRNSPFIESDFGGLTV